MSPTQACTPPARSTAMTTATATATATSTATEPDVASAPIADGAAARKRGHIGRIVAGAVASGLVGAVVLVAGPCAGAREHVITGSVLLAFAFAWAMLALLSQRWTDQPQRWAF